MQSVVLVAAVEVWIVACAQGADSVACSSYQSETQADAAAAAAAVTQSRYSEGLAVADANLIGSAAEQLNVVVVAAVAGSRDYSVGQSTSVAAAAWPQRCFVVQLSDSVARL